MKPELTEQEDLFALLLSMGGEIVEVYRQAFEVDDAPAALHLLMTDRIQARMAELAERFATTEVITRAGHLNTMAELRDIAREAGDIRTAARCEQARGEAAGFYKQATDNGSSALAAALAPLLKGSDADPLEAIAARLPV